VEFSSNLSAIYKKSCVQTFPQIFGLFTIFDRNFAKIVAPPSDENENFVVDLKEQTLLKNAENLVEIGLYTATQCLFKLCTPRMHSAPT